MLSLEEVCRLYDKFWDKDKHFVHKLGLVSIDEHGFWYRQKTKESYLKITDEKKWMLAKIKYGI